MRDRATPPLLGHEFSRYVDEMRAMMAAMQQRLVVLRDQTHETIQDCRFIRARVVADREKRRLQRAGSAIQ